MTYEEQEKIAETFSIRILKARQRDLDKKINSPLNSEYEKEKAKMKHEELQARIDYLQSGTVHKTSPWYDTNTGERLS